MKTSKNLKTLTLILVIVLITILSFLGVYKFGSVDKNNLVKKYAVGVDLSGRQVIRLKVDDDTEEVFYDEEGNEHDEQNEEGTYTSEQKPINDESLLTKENYKKALEIVKARLDYMGVEEYRLRFNEENGTIEIEIYDDEVSNYAVSAISMDGGFEIVDDDTEEVLVNQSSVKNVKVSLASNGIQYCMDIEFNKEGTQKVRDIANTYVTTTEEVTNDEGEIETVTKEKTASIKISGSSIGTVSSGIVDSDGHVRLYFGESGLTSEELERYRLQTYYRGALVATDVMPLAYSIEQNTYIVSNLNRDIISYVAIAILTVEAVIIVLLLKTKKILGVVLQIGYVSLLLLVLKYTNVVITLEGLAALIIISLINVAFLARVMASIKNKKEVPAKVVNDNIVKFINVGIPLIIVSIIFCFVKWLEVKSFGNVIFWGYVIALLYNIIFTKIILKNTID